MRSTVTLLVLSTTLFVACARSGEPTLDRAPLTPMQRDAPVASEAPYAAPDFEIETFAGPTFRLSEHQGTPVVLNFWESW